MFSQKDLKRMAVASSQKVIDAREGSEYFHEPFRHVVIDDFLDPELAEACLENFPALDADSWDHANDKDIEVKYRTKWQSEFDIPDGIVDAIRILNSSIFLKAMASRVGIQKIMPDPYFTGGGLNVTMPGGLLDVHVDGNYHDATGLNRRLNAIIYLHPEWKPDWGGEFGLYDRTGVECVKRVEPLFNRLLIFDTHDFSFHGLPDPVKYPPGTSRKSIILYYYTKEDRPPEHVKVGDAHSALWMKRELKDKRGNETRSKT